MIVLAHGAPAFGAVERYVLAIARALAEREADAALVFPDDPALDPFRELGGALTLVPIPSTTARSAPAVTRFLAATMRRLRPSLVHVTDVWPPALIAARLARVQRLLLTHHTPELPRRDNLAGRLALELGWLARPEVIYTSETDRDADGRRTLMTYVVPLGIDLPRFHGEPRAPDPDSPVIGNVARLAPQKGHRTLINAAPLVLEHHRGARFVVVGDGELRGELEAATRALGVDERFTFTGTRDDVPELLRTFDVFAFPSLFEGLCLAVIEAQAAGVPVVATPVGGIRETVVSGETGVLVPTQDARALAHGILKLLSEPMHARSLAQEAQRRVNDRFGQETMVRRTLELYDCARR
jgi:glycosyltransferase involved in cell wall biosynthesis